MTFLFFGDHRLTKRKFAKTFTATAALACIFENHAGAQAGLSMAMDGRPNAVLMPGLDYSPNGPKWITSANFWQIF